MYWLPWKSEKNGTEPNKLDELKKPILSVKVQLRMKWNIDELSFARLRTYKCLLNLFCDDRHRNLNFLIFDNKAGYTAIQSRTIGQEQ